MNVAIRGLIVGLRRAVTAERERWRVWIERGFGLNPLEQRFVLLVTAIFVLGWIGRTLWRPPVH